MQGYYRQAIALQCMGRYAESLAAYASALAHDGSSQQLLQALVEAALKSPLQGTDAKCSRNMKFYIYIYISEVQLYLYILQICIYIYIYILDR